MGSHVVTVLCQGACYRDYLLPPIVPSPQWHDERTKGTRPIHAATGAPSNFSGLLNYAVGSSRQARDGDGGAAKVGGNSATGGAGLAGCGVNLVDLATDGT